MSVEISILALFLVIIQFILRKKIINQEADRMSETSGKHVSRWGNIILVVMGVLFFIYLDLPDLNLKKLYWLGLLVVVLSFNFLIEWKYIRESREHIVTLITLVFSLIYSIVIEF